MGSTVMVACCTSGRQCCGHILPWWQAVGVSVDVAVMQGVGDVLQERERDDAASNWVAHACRMCLLLDTPGVCCKLLQLLQAVLLTGCKNDRVAGIEAEYPRILGLPCYSIALLAACPSFLLLPLSPLPPLPLRRPSFHPLPDLPPSTYAHPHSPAPPSPSCQSPSSPRSVPFPPQPLHALQSSLCTLPSSPLPFTPHSPVPPSPSCQCPRSPSRSWAAPFPPS